MAEPEKAATTEHPHPHHEAPPSTVVHEKSSPPPPPPPPLSPPPSSNLFGVADVVLRFLLFASALVAVLVMVTSKQTKKVQVNVPPSPRPVTLPVPAKFTHSPALIYFVAALSVAGFYSIITTILSLFSLLKRNMPTLLFSHLVILDVLLLGIVASATGAAGAVTYIGLKGNSHTGWTKICNRYDKFCRHIGSSAFVSLFASLVLVLLVLLNIYALSKKIPK